MATRRESTLSRMRTSLLTASLWLCACGPVAAPPRLDRSMEASRSALLEAAVSVDRAEERVLRAELQVWDHILATRALGPSARGRQETLIDHVLHALEHNQPLAPARQSETPLLALLSTPALRLRGALQRGWLGLVPLLHAPLPGRFLFIVEDTLLAADLGSVSAPVRLPGLRARSWRC